MRVLDCCVVVIRSTAGAVARDYDVVVIVDSDSICAVIAVTRSVVQLIPLFHTVCVVLDCNKIGGAAPENETAYVNVGEIIQSD